MRYFSEKITGVTNDIVYGEGLTSIQAEPKRLINVMLTITAQEANWIEGWFEREQQLLINDYLIPINTDPFRFWYDINYDIAIGKTWKLALRCGANARILYCSYGYEITG